MNNPIRILLVDDSPYFLEAAREFLQFQEVLTVVDVAYEEEEALSKSLRGNPDVILLDLNLAHRSGLELIPLFRRQLPQVKIIVLTMMEAESYRTAALRAGADAFVHKTAMSKTLVSAILETMSRDYRPNLTDQDNPARQGANENESRFLRLAEHLPDLIYRYEFAPRRGFTYVSPAATAMTGYTPEDHYADPDLGFKLVHPDDHHLLQDIAEGRADMQSPLVLRWIRKDGTLFWAEQHNVPVFDEGGALIACEGVARDITERKRAEANLAYQANLLAHISDAVVSTDGEMIIRSWNQAAERMLGYTAEETIGKSARGFLSPEYVNTTREEAFQQLNETGHWEGEVRMKHKDGRLVHATVAGSVLRDEAGTISGFLSVNHDITQRKLAEHALQDSRAQLQGIFDSAMDAIITIDEGQRIIFFNRAAEQMYGCAASEALGRPLTDFMPEYVREEHAEFVRLFGLSSETKRSMETPSLELNCLRTDGMIFPSEVSISQLEFEGQKLYTAIVRDITERKKAEEEIRRLKDFNESLINNMLEGIVVQNTDGVFTYVNPAVAAITGYPPEELVGEHWTKFFPADQQAIIVEADHRRSAGEASQYELDFLHKSGRRINLLVSGSPLFENQRFNGTMAVFTDITERKQAEDKIKLQIKRLSALKDIDHTIASSLDLTFNLQTLIDHVVSDLNVDASAILIMDTNLTMLEYAAAKGFREKGIIQRKLMLGEDNAGRAALERRAIHIPDLTHAELPLTNARLVEKENFVSYWVVPLIAKGKVKGVLEVFHRFPLKPDAEWQEYLETLAGQAAIAIDNMELFMNLEHRNYELVSAYEATIEGWSRAMDLRDKETEGHTLRVTEKTLQLARSMGLPIEELAHIRRGSLLHDIGKMGVPDGILLKPGALTDEEWKLMRKHPAFAYEMLLPIRYLKSAAIDIPYCHHEKWDGSGYPRGLQGEDIPLSARIFAIVDVWDAVTSDRPYRPAWSKEQALAFIREQNGKHFDPQVVTVFLKLISETAQN